MSSTTYSSSHSFSSVPSPQVFWGDHRPRRTYADEIPALGGTLVQLELLMKPFAIDLESVTHLIRSDFGLTFQLLRRARAEANGNDELWRISDCVIDLGPELLELARPLCDWAGHREYPYAEAEAFWMHAKLVARIAEETAKHFRNLNVNPEQVYIAGLLCNLDHLPRLFDSPISPAQDSNEWLVECNLPSFVMEVQNSSAKDPDRCPTPLAHVISFARCWADICLPLAATCPAKKTRFKLPELQAATVIRKYFGDAQLEQFMETLRVATLNIMDEVRPEPAGAFRSIHRVAQI